jgi:phosphoribosylanthranilate isomerase
MKDLKIKICGMTDVQNTLEICTYNPDFIGFIFYSRSLRFVGENPDPALFSTVPDHIQKTAVFVNENYERMLDIIQKYKISTIQLHGMESPELCKAFKLKGFTVIKVFPGDQVGNFSLLKKYEAVTDFFLYDTPVMSYGGSGRKFDWSHLKNIEIKKRFFISGGIAADDAQSLKELKYPMLYAADVNSRFEKSPGIKDPKLLLSFIKTIRNEE